MTQPGLVYPWQGEQWQQLMSMRQANHLPHALLVAGSQGTGKNDFANLLVNSLLCEQTDPQGYACGECKNCKVKQSHAHPDYKEVTLPTGKQQIPISAIRELIEFLTLSRSYSNRRVVLIQPADKMNDNAANSLLKALEEPPAETVMILVADQPAHLPATVRSRCQLFPLPVPDQQMALAWLQQQPLQHEAQKMLSLADGKPLLALQLDTDEVLLAAYKRFATDLVAVLQQTRSVVDAARDWQKTDLDILLNWQLKWLQAALKAQLLATTDTVSAGNKFLDQIIASSHHPEVLWHLYTELLKLKAMTGYPLNRLIFLESMLLLWRDVGASV